jgi:hypothetical protein
MQVRGDSLILELGVECPDIVKIDVEGAELGVLMGLEGIISNDRGPRLVVLEILDGLRSQDIFRWFEDRGYEYRRVMIDPFQIRRRLERARGRYGGGNYAFHRCTSSSHTGM